MKQCSYLGKGNIGVCYNENSNNYECDCPIYLKIGECADSNVYDINYTTIVVDDGFANTRAWWYDTECGINSAIKYAKENNMYAVFREHNYGYQNGDLNTDIIDVLWQSETDDKKSI